MGRRLKLPSRHQRSGSWSTAPLRVGPATCARTTPVEDVLVSQTEKASRKRSRGTEPLVARRRTARSTLTTRTRAVLPAQRTAPLQGFRQGRSSLWRSAVARPIWPPSWRLRASTTQGWPSLPKTATATSAAALRRLNTGRRRASQRTTKTRRLVLEPRRAAATCNETPTKKKKKVWTGKRLFWRFKRSLRLHQTFVLGAAQKFAQKSRLRFSKHFRRKTGRGRVAHGA